MSFKGLKSPLMGGIKNPLKRADKSKLKAHHASNLGKAGLKEPNNPLK